METTTPFVPTFWENKAENMIVKRASETLLFIIQVLGRDLGEDFCHLHRRVTYPSKERLDEAMKKFTPSTEEEYEILLAAYFQINDPKRELFNQRRQAKYEQKLKMA
jgi:hypothetical protein